MSTSPAIATSVFPLVLIAACFSKANPAQEQKPTYEMNWADGNNTSNCHLLFPFVSFVSFCSKSFCGTDTHLFDDIDSDVVAPGCYELLERRAWST